MSTPLESDRTRASRPLMDISHLFDLALRALCRAHGTTTEGVFQAVVAGLDLARVLAAARLSMRDRRNLASWRGSLPQE